jgi:hypothetical protein
MGSSIRRGSDGVLDGFHLNASGAERAYRWSVPLTLSPVTVVAACVAVLSTLVATIVATKVEPVLHAGIRDIRLRQEHRAPGIRASADRGAQESRHRDIAQRRVARSSAGP